MRLGSLLGLAKAMFGGGSSDKSTIGDLEVDAIIERTTTFESEVTDYPVEDGFPVADHVTRKPLTLSMTVICTPTPMDGSGGILAAFGAQLMGNKQNKNTLQGTADKIMDIYQKGEPITITTPDAIYTDMIMTSAPLVRSATDGICYKLALDFKHVRIVIPQTEKTDEDAEGKSGQSETQAGAASQTQIGTGMTTIDSQPFIQLDSMATGLTVAGIVTTGGLQKAATTALSIHNSLKSAVNVDITTVSH